MPAKKKTSKNTKRAANPARSQLGQLRKSIRVLKLKLEREAKARKVEARIKSEAKQAGVRLTTQLKSLRDQGRKLASELKSALGDASKREAARKETLARIAELRAKYAKTSAGLKAELSQKTADLRRKSEELMKLAGQSAHRAAEIIRGEEHHAPVESTKAGSTEPSEPADERGFPEPPTEGALREIEKREEGRQEDDEGPDEEHR